MALNDFYQGSVTVSFDNSDKFWKTRYSFVSSCYAWLNKTLSSFKGHGTTSVSNDDLIYLHDKTTEYNKFHGGSPLSSAVQVSFNDKVSTNKIYKSMSVEGTQNIENALTIVSVNSDNLPLKSYSLGRVKDKGGILYVGMGKNLYNSSASVKCLGLITGVRPINPGSTKVPDEFLPDDYEHPLTNQISTADEDAFDLDRYWAIRVSGNEFSAQSKANWDDEGGEVKYRGGLYFVKEVVEGGLGDYVGDYDLMSQSLLTGTYSALRDKKNLNDPDGQYAADMQDIGRPSADDTFDVPNQYNGEKILYLRTDFDLSNGSSFIETYFSQDGSDEGALNYETKKYALYQVNPNTIFGDEPRGQYCDLTIALGTEKFEVYAFNVNYEPTNLDHSR